MQPYLFPYIGYFQLLQAVDIFVIYDDVNFIKQGWIARNRILLNGSPFMVNIVLNGASSFKKINEIEVSGNNIKFVKTIENAYCKAPYFADAFPVICDVLQNKEINLAKYLTYGLHAIIRYLDIHVSILVSSEISKDSSLKGEYKVINICKQLHATNYINAIGGQELYSKEKFARNELTLNFIKLKSLTYNQFNDQFVSGLSIIDVMMFNSPNEIMELLNQYELI